MKMKTYSFKAPEGFIPSGINTSEFIRTQMGKPHKVSTDWASSLLGMFLTVLPIILIMAVRNRELGRKLAEVKGKLEKEENI